MWHEDAPEVRVGGLGGQAIGAAAMDRLEDDGRIEDFGPFRHAAEHGEGLSFAAAPHFSSCPFSAATLDLPRRVGMPHSRLAGALPVRSSREERLLDHDRLFKELLATFLPDFLDLFAPEMAREVEPGSVELLDKQVFSDLRRGERHDVDLLARVRLRGFEENPRDAYVLVHVETQAQRERDFAHRMYRYFAFLQLKHDLPIYPIALFSFERPLRRQPARFDVLVPGMHVMRFRFRVVQLNRMDWRAFLKRPNPVAAALMARMRIAPADRPRAKLECLRLLATLRLDPARTRLISGFVDTYLRLTGDEQKLFEAEVRQVPEEERGKVMELTTSWKEEGIELGRHQATLELVLRQLTRRIGDLPAPAEASVRSLSQADLEELAVTLLDFQVPQDLDRWFADRASS